MAVDGGVQFVEQASNARALAYQWRIGEVYGTAEQIPFYTGEQDFDVVALDYLNKTEARCPGEFAVVPDQTDEVAGVRVDSYEIACVAADVSSTASILFFSRGSTFTILTHEAPTELMDEAITMKEAVSSYLLGGWGAGASLIFFVGGIGEWVEHLHCFFEHLDIFAVEFF